MMKIDTNPDAPKVWLASDWHFNHSKPFLYEPRGFTSVEEMNEAIVERHNSLVAPEDIVYVLGDLMLGGNSDGMQYVERLNGRIRVVLGNHDTLNRMQLYSQSGKIESVSYCERLIYKKTDYWLSHYPMLVANFEDPKPVFNIHGHTHDSNHFNGHFHCFNVCMDATDCCPVLLEDIHQVVKHKDWSVQC